MSKDDEVWSAPLVSLLLSGAAAVRGDAAGARGHLLSAIPGFETADMRLYATAARYRLSQVEGGDGGRALLTEAETWLRDEGVESAARFVVMLAPGWEYT